MCEKMKSSKRQNENKIMKKLVKQKTFEFTDVSAALI